MGSDEQPTERFRYATPSAPNLVSSGFPRYQNVLKEIGLSANCRCGKESASLLAGLFFHACKFIGIWQMTDSKRRGGSSQASSQMRRDTSKCHGNLKYLIEPVEKNEYNRQIIHVACGCTCMSS